MPQYKLNYFDLKWLGEPIRLILSFGGLDFEDRRFQFEEWPSIKPTTPLGQAPYLEIEGGKTLSQTKAICRYLAKKTGLMPTCDWDAARCDMVADYVDDLRGQIGKLYFESDQEIKNSKLTTFVKDEAPRFLSNFEKLLKENGSNGFFVGTKITWADIYAFDMLTTVQVAIEKMGQSLSFDSCPQIQNLISKVEAVPSIAQWIEKRPKTDV